MRVYYDTTSPIYGQALEKYRSLGKQLYGMEKVGGRDALNRTERREAIMGRRILESAFPRLRELEEEDYKDKPSKSKPAPRIFVEMAMDGMAGRIVYPDGSRSQYAVKAFKTPDQMYDIIAEMAYYGIVDPEVTQVTIGGSAQPLLTFIRGRG